MNKILQDKKILGGIGVLIAVIILIGGYFLVFNKSQSGEPTAPEEEEILTLSPEEIGLSLALSDDGQKVIMEVTKVEDIKSLEYQLTYNSEGDVPRGVIGEVEMDGKPIKKEIVLGTCSDVCHYDENVSDIKIVVKVVKEDGKAYQVEKALEK